MKSIPLRDSFVFQHMVKMLGLEPDWTVEMYGVYNDLERETIRELRREYDALRAETLAREQADQDTRGG